MDTTSNPSTLVDSTSTIDDTTKIFSGLTNDINYYFRLTAVDLSNNESGYSDEVSAMPVHIDSIPPAIPQNLSAIAGDSVLTLTWNMVVDPDSIYYRVYMDTLTNPVTLIDSTANKADTSIVINNLKNNMTYYCRLTAVDGSNNESGFSNEVYATPVHIDSIPPAIPQNLSAVAEDSTITLTWNMVNDPDSIHYRVYMDTTSNPLTLIDSTINYTDTSIVINNLKYNTTYYFRLTAVDKYLNESEFSNEVQMTLVYTDININNSDLPITYSLKQNYPNPFNPITTIEYQLPKQNHVDLSIYNMLGQKVTCLISDEQPAGTYTMKWNANDFASGVYYYQLISGSFHAVRKMVLLK
jgi:small nuclear ribonucleoprotein (snRNP)-like protein